MKFLCNMPQTMASMKTNASKLWPWASAIALIVVYRVLPHPTNISPVIALSLLAGSRKTLGLWSFLIAPLAMLLSDVALEALFGGGFHIEMGSVYLSLIIAAAIGRWLSDRNSVLTTAFAAATASTAFFLITNLAVWAFEYMYPKTMEGLVTCFVAAIPFFTRSLVADIILTVAAFALARAHSPMLRAFGYRKA